MIFGRQDRYSITY